MKKLSGKGALSFAAAMALCAFAVPPMASASSWGVVGSEHKLDSQNFGFLTDAPATSTMCNGAQFTVRVVSTAVIEITAADFAGCTMIGGSTGTCIVTPVSTGLPWTATAHTTSDIQIHGVHIDLFFDHDSGTGCIVAGMTMEITGTLSGAIWTGNASHEFDLVPGVGGSGGLVLHPGFGDGQTVTVTGTFADTQGTLTVTN